jgi:hypothetical protein
MTSIPSVQAQAARFVDVLESFQLDGLGMSVGIQGQGVAPGENDAATVVRYALHNEFGTENIPERPFLRTSFAAHRRLWIEALRRGLRLRLAGDTSQPAATLRVLGVVAVGQVQRTLREGQWAPNAPATIRRKTRAGRRGDQPLVDTSQLVQSIRAAIESRNGSELVG